MNTPKFSEGQEIEQAFNGNPPVVVRGVRARYEYLLEYKDGSRSWDREEHLQEKPKSRKRK